MRKTLTVAGLAACLVPALAFAADPATNSTFQWCKSTNNCPLTFRTNGTGTRLKKIAAYNKCAQIPANYGKIKVKGDGSFSKSGTTTDATGQPVQYAFEGRFTRPKKAKGTYDLDTRRCKAQPTDFVAKKVTGG